MLFPHSYYYDVVYTSTNSKVFKCVGVGKTDINREKTKKGMKTRSIVKATSLFPSDLTIKNDVIYSKGGFIIKGRKR